MHLSLSLELTGLLSIIRSFSQARLSAHLLSLLGGPVGVLSRLFDGGTAVFWVF